MTTMGELEILKMVCQRLHQKGIPYMITGSIATNVYAVPRMTRDIDIVIEVSRDDIERLSTMFKDHFYIDREAVTQAVDEQGMFNIIHNESVIKVDFIIRKDSPYRLLEFQRRRPMEVEGIKMWIVSPEDLILSKLFWAKESESEMQLGDVKNLFGVVKDLDFPYIEQWVHTLGLQHIYQKVKL